MEHRQSIGLSGFGLTFRKVVSYAVSFYILRSLIGFFGGIYVDRATGYEIGNRRRFVSVMRLELIMIYSSVLIYLHLFSYFHSLGDCPSTLRSYYLRKLELQRSRYLLIFMAVMIGAHITYLFYFLPFNVPYLLLWPCAFSLGLWMHLLFFSILFMGGNAAISVFETCASGRALLNLLCSFGFLKAVITNRKTQVFITLITTMLMSVIMWIASDKVSLKQVNFHLPHFPKNAAPLRLAMITDLHGGTMVFRDQVAKVVDRTNAIESEIGKPVDAVLLIGDWIDAPVSLIEDRMEPLRHLHSRLGTFAVSGNHEFYYGDYKKWKNLFTEYGIQVMENSVEHIDNSTCLVGLHDISANKSGIAGVEMDETAISHCFKNESIVVLSHNPAAAKRIMAFSQVSNHPVDLILSGHTHSAQYYVLYPLVYWMLPYLYGVYDLVAGAKLFVSAGTLYQAAPMKIVGRSEIWLVTISG